MKLYLYDLFSIIQYLDIKSDFFYLRRKNFFPFSGFFGRPDSIMGPPPVPEFPYTDLSMSAGVSVVTADKREYLEPKPVGPKYVDEGTQVR